MTTEQTQTAVLKNEQKTDIKNKQGGSTIWNSVKFSAMITLMWVRFPPPPQIINRRQ